MNGACNSNFFLPPPPPWGPGEGSKVKYHLISITKSISKIFVPNFVCVQNISDGIFILLPRSCPRGGTLGRWGCPSGQKKDFKHGHVAYQINGDDKQNRMQVTFSSCGQTGDLGVRSKGQISLTCQFQRFLYQTLCVFSQIKDRKHFEQNFHSVARVLPRDGTSGAERNQNLAWGFAMAPH